VFERLKELKGHIKIILEENESIINNLYSKDECIEQLIRELRNKSKLMHMKKSELVKIREN
jgi:hypothetical protein